MIPPKVCTIGFSRILEIDPNTGNPATCLFFRRKSKSHSVVFKMPPVRTITKWFVAGQAASAQGDFFPAAQVILISVLIYDLKFPVDDQGPVVVDCDLCFRHIY